MSDQEIAQIELSMEESRKLVNSRQQLQKLEMLPEFKELIIEGYLKDNAVRLTWLLDDPNMQSPEQQASLLTELKAVAVFRQYLMGIHRLGTNAEQSIADSEVALEEIAQEEAN